MLVLALGLVLVAMRQLGQPETVERLDQLFGANRQTDNELSSEQTFADVEISAQDQYQLPAAGPVAKSPVAESPVNEGAVQEGEPTVAVEGEGIDLSAVRDKTYFRPEERPAWFGLLGQLQQMSEAELAEKTLGEISYAQLLQQPEVYRGRVVTLRGTVIREERQQLSDASLGLGPRGLEEYHRLWIQPQGGGLWPFVVYCLRLPSDFPRGDAIHATVQIDGFFFKNWSYAWEDGLGLAPVVLADQPIWQPPVSHPAREQNSWQTWTVAISIATTFAMGVIWLALIRTRRRTINPEQEEAIRQRFVQLAEEDNT